MVDDPEPGWKRNTGTLPEEAKGKRVAVILASGAKYDQPLRSDLPHGWAADGKNGCRWSRTNSPADIEWYRVL